MTMLLSMFSSFDAFSAKSLVQKVKSALGPIPNSPYEEEGNSKTGASKKEGVGESTGSSQASDSSSVSRHQQQKMRPRFAPELDGVYCFETILPC